MNSTLTTPEVFLAQIAPFDRLSIKTRAWLGEIAQYYRYHVGQPIAIRDRLPAQINIVVAGTVRLLGYPSEHTAPITLERLATGDTIGIIGAIRGLPCEAAIASTESICLNIPTEAFMEVLVNEADLTTIL